MNFSKNLRYLRKRHNLSQEFIANKLGYKSYTTIQKWESGSSEPNYDKLKFLSELFNVSIDSLVNKDLSIDDCPKSEKDKLLKISPWLGNLVNIENEELIDLLSKISDLTEEEIHLVNSLVDKIIK